MLPAVAAESIRSSVFASASPAPHCCAPSPSRDCTRKPRRARQPNRAYRASRYRAPRLSSMGGWALGVCTAPVELDRHGQQRHGRLRAQREPEVARQRAAEPARRPLHARAETLIPIGA
jgi:hypothetical protein